MDSSLILLDREACRNLRCGLAPPAVLELARSAACLRGRDQHALVGRCPRREAGVGFGINHRDPHPLGPAGVLICQRKHREGRRHESPPSRSQYAGVIVQEIAPHADSLRLAAVDALGCVLARDDIVLLCDASPALLDPVSTWWRRIAAAALDRSDAVARAAFDSLARLFQEFKSKCMSRLAGDKLIDTENSLTIRSNWVVATINVIWLQRNALMDHSLVLPIESFRATIFPLAYTTKSVASGAIDVFRELSKIAAPPDSFSSASGDPSCGLLVSVNHLRRPPLFAGLLSPSRKTYPPLTMPPTSTSTSPSAIARAASPSGTSDPTMSSSGLTWTPPPTAPGLGSRTSAGSAPTPGSSPPSTVPSLPDSY